MDKACVYPGCNVDRSASVIILHYCQILCDFCIKCLNMQKIKLRMKSSIFVRINFVYNRFTYSHLETGKTGKQVQKETE